GVVAANNIVRRLKGDDVEVLLADKTGYHVFQPSQLWVMLGQREPDDIRRPLKLLERRGVRVLIEEVKAIKPENHIVTTGCYKANGKFE
ncbi:MAG: NAD(P)/FAD-dependent oxidoreductase, partial [Acidilobaceae archaeon]